MHDSADTSFLRRGDQGARVLHGSLKRGLPARESHPIGIDQRGSASQRFREPPGIVEVVGKDLDFVPEGILTLGMVRQRSNPISAIKQNPRGVLARVTERPSDDDRLVRFGVHLNGLRSPLRCECAPARANGFGG